MERAYRFGSTCGLEVSSAHTTAIHTKSTPWLPLRATQLDSYTTCRGKTGITGDASGVGCSSGHAVCDSRL